mmetsp:Transcript_18242/g.32693  ORF Transcript_18242/g.32693 Transcript_18242/m.32693 type:complete len:537 (-) Transcript_18242:54-1664(-)
MTDTSTSFKLEQRIAQLRDTVSRLNSQRFEPRPNLLGRGISNATGGSEIEKYLEVKYDEDLLGAEIQSKNSTLQPLQLKEALDQPRLLNREKPRNIKRSMSEREIDTLLNYKPNLAPMSPHPDTTRSFTVPRTETKVEEKSAVEKLELKVAKKDAIIRDLLKNLQELERVKGEAIKDCANKLYDYDTRLKQTEQMLQSSEAKTHYLQNQLDDLCVKQSTRERYIKNLEIEQKTLEGKFTEMSEHQQDLQEAYQRSEREKQKLLNDNTELLKEIKRKGGSDEDLQAIKKELEAYKVREKHFGEEAMALHRDRVAYSSEISSLRAQCNSLTIELDKAHSVKREANSDSFMQMRDEVFELKDTLRQKETELKSLYTELAGLRATKSRAEARYLPTDRNSGMSSTSVIDQVCELLKTQRTEEIVERVQQLIKQDASSRHLQTFYSKVAALVRDCNEENGAKIATSKNFVWKWIKRVVEQYMLLKKASDSGVLEECSQLLGIKSPCDVPKHIRRLISENETLNYIGQVARRVTNRKGVIGE